MFGLLSLFQYKFNATSENENLEKKLQHKGVIQTFTQIQVWQTFRHCRLASLP